MTTELTVRESQELAPMTARDVKSQVNLIQEVMRDVMKDKEHYGTIPGCGEKKVLFKAGAEKLCLTFRMAPKFEIQETNLPGGHKEFRVICSLHSANGNFLGSGVGAGSTMESKYRYRRVSDYEVLEEQIPADAKERKGEYAKQGLGMKKIEGAWCWVRFKEGDKQENPDPADCYNTVLKMTKKRAQVDAILTVTAASDIFTQDLEERQPEQEADQERFENAKPLNAPPKTPMAKPAQPQASRPQQGRSSLEATGRKTNKFATISIPQSKRLFAIASNNGGITGEELNRCMGERYPYLVEGDHVHLERMKPEHYEDACKWAEKGCQDEPRSKQIPREERGDEAPGSGGDDDNIPF